MSLSGINSSLNQLNRAQSLQSQSIQRIATGSKRPSAAYGASDYAIARKMQYNIGGVSQSNANTQTANSMLNVASGAVSNTISSLSSLKETLISAANGTNGTTDIAALQETVNQTLSQINTNAQATYNGQTLLDGSQTVTVAGADGYENVSLGDMSTAGLFNISNSSFCTVDDSSIFENKLNEICNSTRKEIERLEYEIYKLSGVPKEKMYGTDDKKKSKKKSRKRL